VRVLLPHVPTEKEGEKEGGSKDYPVCLVHVEEKKTERRKAGAILRREKMDHKALHLSASLHS